MVREIMDRGKITEKLDRFLADIPWRYKILEETKSVELTNVEIMSMREREFLKELDEEGSKSVIEGNGKFCYLINRKNGRLWASLANEDASIVQELGEVAEKEALEVMRSQTKDRHRLGGVVNLLRTGEERKELVSNTLKIGYGSIEDINTEEADKSKHKSVVIVGKEFRIELREDGGCRLYLDLFDID
jgi:hypothetical protein